MSLIFGLLDAIQSWRRRRGGPRTRQRSVATVERLDHRQLLAVNFTGNVPIDFPASQQPGVVVIPDSPAVTHPGLPPDLAPIIKVSGFDINGIRVSYDQASDILSIGLDQPPSQQPGQPGDVIAGDADNNGDDGTVNPAVTALRPNDGFLDFPDFGGSEFMGAFLDLDQSGFADVVAGYGPDDPRMPKLYQVAEAVVNTNAPPTTPGFGTPLPLFTGNVYKVNSPVHPNLEFAINHFSQLYLQETGKTLTPDSVISIGAFAGSGDDDGVGEGFFPEVPFTLRNATVPPVVCPPPPPVSPPVLINPHQNHHINTAHPTDIRVSILGTSGFDVAQINPATVTFGGAHPVANFIRPVNGDRFADRTFVFRGTDVHLPPGVIFAPVTGTLTNGQTFVTAARVFNRDFSFYSPSDVAQAQQRQAADPTRLAVSVAQIHRKAGLKGAILGSTTPGGPAAIQIQAARNTAAAMAMPQTVSIPRKQPVVTGANKGAKIGKKLNASMNAFIGAQQSAAGTMQTAMDATAQAAANVAAQAAANMASAR